MSDDEQIVWRTWDELAAHSETPEAANDEYNNLVSAWEFETDVQRQNDTGKGIPYMGWFWRETDFHLLRIPIGRTDDFVGVMESNKWGYDSRRLTPDEALRFRDMLDTVFVALREDDRKEANRVTQRLWDWMQSLRDVGSWYIEETWEQWQQWQASHKG